MRGVVGSLGRLLGLLVIAALSLQLYFLARVGAMAWLDPQSTAYQRSEAWRLATQKGALAWSHEWLPSARISANLKRAVIASEDAGFSDHSGVEWDALEKAWERNQKAEAAFALRDQQVQQRVGGRQLAAATGRAPKVVGGSTITQQLAKNLLLGGERSLARKGQEFVVTAFLEVLLSKDRILEIYLNSVEWGEGVFGAEAAARRYFHASASGLSAAQAARLAVLLPAPKRFEKRPASPYVLGRAATIMARMGAVDVP
ncbi:MAG: transglycosylase domain-containing protein [Caldimonas sp.]